MSRYVASLLIVSLAVGAGCESFAQETPPAAVKGSQGTFMIGGKTYKLAHAVAYEAKVFDDEYMIHVLASSEPLAADKLKTALRDGKGSDDKFSTFQPHVKLSFDKKTGKTAFCNSYAEGHSLSVSGGGLSGELAVKEGRVVGNAALKGDGDKRGDANFELRFDLELIKAVIAPDDKPKKKEKPQGAGQSGDEPSTSGNSKPQKGKATAKSISVYDLPIPKDATDIERKKLVEHIHFKSPSDMKSMTDYLIKQFDAQQWTKDGSDLTGKKSSILKRNKGDSSLTIFVKPDDTGSTVTIMANGLSWEEKKEATENEPKPAVADAETKPGILASKFPVPEKATDIERDADTEMVTCRSKLSAKEVSEFYSRSLTKLGWKENKDQTLLIESVETGSMNFTKGDDSLQIVIQDGKPKSRTRVVVLGSGLKWEAEEEDKD